MSEAEKISQKVPTGKKCSGGPKPKLRNAKSLQGVRHVRSGPPVTLVSIPKSLVRPLVD
jgi:hypothetical protein